MLCNSPNIRKYINFVDNKLQSEDKYNEMDKIRSKIEYFNKQNDICSNINTEMTDKYIKLPIVIPKKASFMWETSELMLNLEISFHILLCLIIIHQSYKNSSTKN